MFTTLLNYDMACDCIHTHIVTHTYATLGKTRQHQNCGCGDTDNTHTLLCDHVWLWFYVTTNTWQTHVDDCVGQLVMNM